MGWELEHPDLMSVKDQTKIQSRRSPFLPTSLPDFGSSAHI